MATVRGALQGGAVAQDPEHAWAATALILHDHPESGPEILFIERARSRRDRWSGQMALPGGRHEVGDADLVATAIRETHEEVGLTLSQPLGRLPDIGARGRGGFVASVVFEVPAPTPLQLQSSEVASALWIPVAHLLDPANAQRYRFRGLGPFQSIRHGEHVVWGLTWGILSSFMGQIGHRLPEV